MSNYRGWEQTERPLCRLPRQLSTWSCGLSLTNTLTSWGATGLHT